MDLNCRPSTLPKHPLILGNSFSIYHQNIRSLRDKHQEVLSHLFPNLPQVICFTEHHLKAHELQNIHMEQYTLGAQFCRTNHAQGGVVIYTRNSLNAAPIDLSKYCKEKDIEICAVKTKIQSSVLYIIAVYRSPSGNFNLFLATIEAVLQSIYSSTIGIIICGDININYLVVNEHRTQLDNLLLLYNLVGIIDFPTRLTSTTNSAIDNIFIDVTGFQEYEVIPFPNGLSDHDAQLLAFKEVHLGQTPSTKLIRKVDQQNITDFIVNLCNESWTSIFNTDDINHMYNSFLNIYLKIFHASFPLAKVTERNKGNQWITLGIQTSCKRKRELFLLKRSLHSPLLERYYTQYCKILTKVIREAKRMAFSTRISKSHNKTKTTWKIVNELLGKQPSHTDIQQLTVDGIQYSNQQQVAEVFNKYFSTIVDSINSNKPDSPSNNFTYTYLQHHRDYTSAPLVLKPFSTTEIIKIIKSLKTKNSFGYDEISPYILKLSAMYISSPLTYICNKVIATGIFPDRMKYSIVIPILKKGRKNDPTNYRPISLLPSFAKVLESALYKRLSDYIILNNSLTEQQFGFRKNHSTEEAIFKLTHEVLNALNDKSVVGSIFFDLEKAFDSVNHSLLIKKLPYYGIAGKAKLLIESYLTNRHQRVLLKNSRTNSNAVSEWTKVNHGVPQGSVLGPLLFLLYINDLPMAVPSKIIPILFADDTSIIITRSNNCELQEAISASLHQLTKWFQENSLSLNVSKTHFLQFHNKNQNSLDIPNALDSKFITKPNHIKFLGLTINDSMTWKTHIDDILPKLSSACFAIRTVKPYVSHQTLKAIYYAYFHAIMSYGVIFWGQSPDSLKVFLLQKRVIRTMMGCGRRDSCRRLFVELGILTLPSQYIYCLLLFMVKNRELFSSNKDLHSINTRQQLNFHQPSAHLKKYQLGPYYTGIKLYNTLPATLKNESHNPVRFRSLLKKFLSETTLYSLDEYYSICKPRKT